MNLVLVTNSMGLSKTFIEVAGRVHYVASLPVRAFNLSSELHSAVLATVLFQNRASCRATYEVRTNILQDARTPKDQSEIRIGMW